MTATRICLRSLISASLDILPHSSRIIRSVAKGGDIKKSFKIADDPVTIADIQAQALIVSSLQSRFPTLTIIGEEKTDHVTPIKLKTDLIPLNDFPSHLQSLRVNDLVVWVDPLDGTRSFVAGKFEHVTTLIGISHRGLPIAGIIHYPFSGETIWGGPGLGIFGGDISISNEPDRSIGIGFWNKHERIAELRRLFPEYTLVMSGGTGHCCAEVLKGKYGSFISNGGSKWDTCAPEALFIAAGGRILSKHGQQIFYHQHVPRANHGCVASLQNIHELVQIRPKL